METVGGRVVREEEMGKKRGLSSPEAHRRFGGRFRHRLNNPHHSAKEVRGSSTRPSPDVNGRDALCNPTLNVIVQET